MKSQESCEIDCTENEGGDKYVLSNTGQYKAMQDKDI